MAGRSSGPSRPETQRTRAEGSPLYRSRRSKRRMRPPLRLRLPARTARLLIARQLATYPEGVRWPAGPRWLAAAPVGQACPTLRISSPTIVEYERPCIAPAAEPVLLARVRDHRDAVGSRFAGGVFDALHRFEWDRGHGAVALRNPPPYSPGRRTGKLGSRLQAFRGAFKPLLTGS